MTTQTAENRKARRAGGEWVPQMGTPFLHKFETKGLRMGSHKRMKRKGNARREVSSTTGTVISHPPLSVFL